MGCGMTKHADTIVDPNTKESIKLGAEEVTKADQDRLNNKSSSPSPLTKEATKEIGQSYHLEQPKHIKHDISTVRNHENTTSNINNNRTMNPVQMTNGEDNSLNDISNCNTDNNHSCRTNEKSNFIEIKSSHMNRNKLNECRLQRLQSKKMNNNNSLAYEEVDQFHEGMSSPFGQRKTLTLTESQIDFFRMLDEKIAQGKDYCSEDERSISSMISRKSKNLTNASFVGLKSQHVR